MSTGTTYGEGGLRRDELIMSALRRVTKLGENEQVSALQLDAAVRALNLIVRQEDARGVDQAKNLWALSEAAVFIRTNGFVYGVAQGLASNIRDVVSVVYRDRSGGDSPLEMTDARAWGRMTDHKDKGQPDRVYFKRDRLLANQQFLLDRAPTSIGTSSVAIGTDNDSYSCILAHTSSDENRPITGASYPLYWQKGTETPTAWVTATAYTNAELLYYVYKRPLFDFSLPTDNPDFPAEWGAYLIARLAVDLASEYSVSTEKMQVHLRPALVESREMLFNSARSGATDHHNFAEYF